MIQLPFECLTVGTAYAAVSGFDWHGLIVAFFASAYFLWSIYFNVVLKHYKGKWSIAIKDVFKGLKKRIIRKK